MFIVLLRFSTNTAEAPDHLPGHQDWIRAGVDDGEFLLVGSIPGIGGAILAAGTDRPALEARVERDPFVQHDVVTAEVIEVEPNTVDPRLEFLAPTAA